MLNLLELHMPMLHYIRLFKTARTNGRVMSLMCYAASLYIILLLLQDD